MKEVSEDDDSPVGAYVFKKVREFPHGRVFQHCSSDKFGDLEPDEDSDVTAELLYAWFVEETFGARQWETTRGIDYCVELI